MKFHITRSLEDDKITIFACYDDGNATSLTSILNHEALTPNQLVLMDWFLNKYPLEWTYITNPFSTLFTTRKENPVDALVRWARQVRVHDILCNGAWDDFVTFIKSDVR